MKQFKYYVKRGLRSKITSLREFNQRVSNEGPKKQSRSLARSRTIFELTSLQQESKTYMEEKEKMHKRKEMEVKKKK